MRAEITGGEASDYKGFDLLVDGDLPPPKVPIADKGYDSDHIRQTVDENDGTPVIPGRSTRKTQIPSDDVIYIYALRNQVERCFNKLKCARRMTTRYDKTAASYLAFIYIVAARLWAKKFVSRT